MALIFEAGEAAGSYHFDGGHIFAGELKMIRTVLWRRDKTEVPRGTSTPATPKGFSRDWDFADFPVLSPSGFIRSMRVLPVPVVSPQHTLSAPSNWTTGLLPSRTKPLRRDPVGELAPERGKNGRVSYTGIHNPSEASSSKAA